MADANKGFVQSVSDTAANLAKQAGDNLNWAAAKITGEGHEQARHAAGEAVTSENTTIGQKIDGAKNYVSEGAKEAKDKSEAQKHDAKSQYHDEAAKQS